MSGYHHFVVILLFQLVHGARHRRQQPVTEPTPDGKEPNWLALSLLGFAWGFVLILFVAVIIIRKLTKPKIDTVNIASSPSSFYMLKVKTGALSGGFLSGRYGITLDLLNQRNQTMGRVKLPIDPAGKLGSTQTVYVKIGTREPFDVGAIRVTQENYREKVSLENIELRELEGSGKIYRAEINSKVGFPSNDSRHQTFPAHLDETSFGTAEFLEPGEDNLSLLDWVFFMFFAINLIIILDLYVIQHVSFINDYTEAAINGCVTGVIALAVTLGLVLVYRFFIKRSVPINAGYCYLPQVIFFSVCCIFGAALGIAAVVLGSLYPVENRNLTFWGVACAISLILFLILFIPIVIGIECCIKFVRTGDREQKSGKLSQMDNKVRPPDYHGNEYFDAISKKQGGTPIRSISQYRKHPTQSSPSPAKNSTPPKTSKTSPLPVVKKQDSTGSEYFHQINKAGVKSISQYATMKKK